MDLPPRTLLIKASAAGRILVGSIPALQKKSLYALNVETFFSEKMPNRKPEDFLIRVNRQPVARDYVLQENDRVTITPTKIEGALV